MPSTMQEHSRTRAPQNQTRTLAVGDVRTYQWSQQIGGFDAVIIGGAQPPPNSQLTQNSVQSNWAKRLAAQLNTSWVPTCIFLGELTSDHAVADDVLVVPGDVSQAAFDAAWLALTQTAQASSARVVVLQHSDAFVPTAVTSMQLALPADQWVTLPPMDVNDNAWFASTIKAIAKTIADVIYSQ